MASGNSSENGGDTRGSRVFSKRQAEMFSEDFSFSGYERDLLQINLGDGHYLNISGVSGADSVSDGRGAVFADFDNDGDQDIFLRAMHGPAHLLFRNQVGQDLNFVRVALRGTRSGWDAFGAVVWLKTSAGVLTQIKSAGAGFLSQSDPRVLFGLGQDERAEWMEVLWPSGLRQRFAGPEAGESVLLVEGREMVQRVAEQRFSLPAPLSPLEDRFKTLAIKPGEPLPDLTVVGLDGKRHTLAGLLEPGRPVLLSFWATWCQQCAAEMPELQRLHARNESGGLRVLGLSVDRLDAREKIGSVLRRMGVTYPVYLLEPADLGKVYETPDTRVPLSILLDRQLRVVDVFPGSSPKTRLRLDQVTRAIGRQ
ncbi:MAG: redoxin domain-containing protein [bacterium]|nr:redoxin domain-containing protein [bacterium]